MACITPMNIRNKVTGEWQVFPCGKCKDCKGRRASGWSFRLMQEEKRSDSALFVTLTYSTSTVPITKNGFMSLSKQDVQKFFKRLRKLLPETKIKYYVVGEYGGKTMRPHYHAIIFNADEQSVISAWGLDRTAIGSIFFGTVTGASVGYTLKYMMKAPKIPLHRNDDRIREFALSSKDWAATISAML